MSEIVIHETRDSAVVHSATPADILRYAMDQKAEPQYLRELMALQREWEADQARKEFVKAMAAFKAHEVHITKDKLVSYTTSKGRTEYTHATIGNVVGIIVAAMAPHGLSHRWITEQPAGKVRVTCEIRHALGHAETTTLEAAPDDSGGKNTIQATASTVTYLQRYTLLAATGLATNDQEDDDGRGADPGPAHPDAPATGSDAPEDSPEELSRKKKAHDEAAGRNSESVAHIKERLAAGDHAAAANEWRQFSNDDVCALWLAPTKGGTFTTEERKALRKALGSNKPEKKS